MIDVISFACLQTCIRTQRSAAQHKNKHLISDLWMRIVEANSQTNERIEMRNQTNRWMFNFFLIFFTINCDV